MRKRAPTVVLGVKAVQHGVRTRIGAKLKGRDARRLISESRLVFRFAYDAAFELALGAYGDGRRFSTADDNQPAVDIVVLQGERSMAKANRTLGQFKLEGIRSAPRGVPQIEVSFDIDANGILNVSAKDKDTGKEQKITISGSTNLDKSEIDQMVQDAETHAQDDRQRKELVEELNQADSLAHQVEKAIQDLGDRVPAHEKARCELLISEIRTAVKDEAPIERIRQLKSDLQQASYNISKAAYQGAQEAQGNASGGSNGGGGENGGGPGAGSDGNNGSKGRESDDYIDAEYTEV